MSRLRYQTPRTFKHWSTLAEWLDVAYGLEQRRSASLNKERRNFHVQALPLHLIDECEDAGTLTACHRFLTRRQPCRGQREHAPHTALIVALNNRISRLGVVE